MPLSLRRVVGVLTVVAALGFAACLHTAFAQPLAVTKTTIAIPIGPNPTAGIADAASFDLPKDTQARRSIEAALDYINAKRGPEVVEALQRILDDPQDKFAPLPRKGPDGKEVSRPDQRSRRSQSPPRQSAGRRFGGVQDLRQGRPQGRRIPQESQRRLDHRGAARLARPCGAQLPAHRRRRRGGRPARHPLHGSRRLPHRQPILQSADDARGGADSLSPETLFRAAYAFHQADDKAGEDSIWQTALLAASMKFISATTPRASRN